MTAPVEVGTSIPPWSMPSVDPARMKTMAAILRDPYPVHWDRSSVEAFGLGPRVINQGPLNLSYIMNMLMAWQGPRCLRRVQVSFGRPVLDGESVEAGGIVTAIDDVDGERVASCDVWLDRDGEHVVTGTALVAVGLSEGRLQQVYGFEEPGEVRDYYDEWADSYDDELAANGYASPARVAAALADLAPDLDVPVLDYGCGTGLSGEALRTAGFTTIDGADPSTEMLAVAAAKNLYRNLVELDLGSPPPFAAASWSVIAAIGVIGPGAAPLSLLYELIELLAPGGLFGLSLNDHALDDPAYPAALADVVDRGLVEVAFDERGPHLPGIDVQSTVLVLRRR